MDLLLEIEKLSNWRQEESQIRRIYTFDTFHDAITYMSNVAPYCDEIDHHPEWKNVYNKLDVVLTTHDENGITIKDINLAKYLDSAFNKQIDETRIR